MNRRTFLAALSSLAVGGAVKPAAAAAASKADMPDGVQVSPWLHSALRLSSETEIFVVEDGDDVVIDQ